MKRLVVGLGFAFGLLVAVAFSAVFDASLTVGLCFIAF